MRFVAACLLGVFLPLRGLVGFGGQDQAAEVAFKKRGRAPAPLPLDLPEPVPPKI